GERGGWRGDRGGGDRYGYFEPAEVLSKPASQVGGGLFY
ncbi:MAG: hypothetical protein RIS24_3278, partial [Verrucomicrobiota bacterium]